MARSDVVIRISGDTSGLNRSLTGAQKNLSGFGSKVGRTAKNIGKIVAVGIGGAAVGVAAGIGAVLKTGFAGLKEAETNAARTRNVIETTGGAAKVSARDVETLSDAIETMTGFDAEAVQAGENLLLTFTNVRNEAGKGNDIFNQTTKLMADMSVAMGQDTKASAIQLGKALNDPVKGVSALSKVGVSFTEQQKEQIKTLVESGDTLGAQKIILGELSKEFGGAATAAGSTFGGRIEKLKRRFESFAESVAKRALPIVEAFIKFVDTKVAPIVEKAGDAVYGFIQAFRGEGVTSDGIVGKLEEFGVKARAIFDEVVATVQRNWPTIQRIALAVWAKVRAALQTTIQVIAAIVGWFNKNRDVAVILAATIATLVAGFRAFMFIRQVIAAVAAFNAVLAANPIGIVVVAIAALVAGLIIAYRKVGWFRTAVNTVGNVIKAVFNWVRNNWKLLGFILLAPIAPVILAFTTFRSRIVGIVGSVVDWIRGHWKLLLAIITGPIGAATLFIIGHFTTIREKVNGIVDFFRGLPGRLASVAGNMFGFIKEAFKSAVNWIIDRWNGLEFKVGAFDPPGPGSFGGFTVGVPNIPRLHAGTDGSGFRPLVGQREGLAILRRGEEVVTPGRAGAGGGITIHGGIHIANGTPASIVNEFRWYRITQGVRVRRTAANGR